MERLKRLPDDMTAIRSLALHDEMINRFPEAMLRIRPYVDNGKATASDLNRYAWDALFLPGVGQDAIEAAQRANSLTGNKNSAILHTLACLYAETGKTSEARELLLQTIDEANLEEPNGAIWYGFARIAEQYGENDAALADYKRVDLPEESEPLPVSTYALAQNRMKALSPAMSKANK
jgi:tetratricopeptide (TPR) repeat protein